MLVNSGNLIVSVNDILSKYQKISLLGEGSYGQVFKVSGPQGDRALKILARKGEQTLGEIENMKRLDHPNIMATYEIGQDEKNFYIINELIPGTELFVEIHRRLQLKQIFSENEVRIIFKQILSAIAYAHDKHIIHRDIKPENILIDEDYHIKIIDWGLSKDMREIAQLRQRIGTVDYAAPEVLSNKGYDGKCDLWSAGVILYILLSGETPFPGNTTGEIEAMIIKSKINMKQKIWKSVSAKGKDLLSHLLQQDPNKRYSAKEALEHEWIQEKTLPLVNEAELQYRMEKLSHFCCQSKLVQATFHLMIQQNLKQSKLKELRNVFQQIDKNGDGRLSLEELSAHYNKEEAEQIFKRIDTDGSGFIDFTEFLAAAVDMRNVASYQQMKQAFSVLDQNNDGYLEIHEIKQILGSKISVTDEEQWTTLLGELDANNDGKISFDEYYSVISKFIEESPQSVMPSQDFEPPIVKKIKNSKSLSISQQSTAIKRQNSQQSPYNLRKR